MIWLLRAAHAIEHVVCLGVLDGDGAEEVVSGDAEAGEVVEWGR